MPTSFGTDGSTATAGCGTEFAGATRQTDGELNGASARGMTTQAAGLPLPVLSAVLDAALCRSLERKSSIFLGFVFSCQRGGRRFAAELRSASAKRAPASPVSRSR